jgi:hypothetical protein
MPVIVEPASYARWLDPTQPGPPELLTPCANESLTWWPVATRVNNVRHDDPSLIEPVAGKADADAHASPGEVAVRGEAMATTADADAGVEPIQERLF